jgi:8-oxo-dGTP pyrophosphatase MutT (NUDIX family)
MTEKKDKYGNPIPRFGQGWGVDDALKNEQGYRKDGTKDSRWLSRSCAVCAMVYAYNPINDTYYILANKRGSGALDYKGYWNMPCGYLDYNETAEQAAVRECYEETGIKIDKPLKFVRYSTDPTENRQNVVFFFSVCLGDIRQYQQLSTEHMEENEVEGLQWIPFKDVDKYQWAFDHDEIIKRYFSYYL